MLGALHEIAGGGNGAIDGAVRLKGKVLWCVTRPDLFAPALAQVGLLPGRVICVEAGDERALLSCMEEGLRHGGPGVVIGELTRLSMTASRRLQLAAESSGTIGIAVRRWRRQTEASDFGQPTASVTRWRVSVCHPLPCRFQASVGRAGCSSSSAVALAKVQISKWRPPMPRVVSLFLPMSSTDRLGRKLGDAAPPSETPLVLIGREQRRRVVLEANGAAIAAGLRGGMPASKAQAPVTGLIVNDADPAADAEALERLALWALQRYVPIAAADPPDGMVAAKRSVIRVNDQTIEHQK